MAILTYSAVYYFYRRANEDWQTALQKPFASVSLPSIEQWEGASFSADGKKLVIVHEGRGENTVTILQAPWALKN
ncbi:MAG: hypothetical protein B7X28_02880 [Halothiobacillus sp. 13-55-253]|nr:MAG: hypothetical protein B7X28_02880 [Halothiobacillus sp. 13-55-253]